MKTLDSIDHHTRNTDEFVRTALRAGIPQPVVVAHVAASRNLTPDHAAGVVGRRVPSVHVECKACGYVWAYAVSRHGCPSCGHDHFADWHPPLPEILEPFIQSMADELGIPREEMPV